jgi:hypothetical protein
MNSNLGPLQTAKTFRITAALMLLAAQVSISQDIPAKESEAIPPKVGSETAKTNSTGLNQPPDGQIADIRPFLHSQILPHLSGMIIPPQDIELELWFDKNGKVEYAAIFKGGHKKADARELSETDKKKAGRLLSDLGAAEFKTREEAVKELTAMGSQVLPLVKALTIKTQDPEVGERCRQIADKLDTALNLPRIDEVEAFLRSRTYRASTVGGKRYVAPISKAEIESFINSSRFPVRAIRLPAGIE